MTSGLKIAAVAFMAALSIGAAATGSASANWFVGGSELAAGKSAALATLASIDGESLLFHFLNGGTPFIIACTGPIHLFTGLLQAGNAARVSALTFLGCKVTAPATCKLTSSEIKFKPVQLLAKLGPSAPSDRLTVSPLTGKEFTELKFEEGTGCPLGEITLKGLFTLGAPKGQNEEVKQPLEGLGTVENNSLEFGTNKATFTGGWGLVLLASGSKWSFK